MGKEFNQEDLNEYKYLKSNKKFCLDNIYWVCSPDCDLVIPILVDVYNSTLINMLTLEKCPVKLREFDEKSICRFCVNAFNSLYNKNNLFCVTSLEALSTYCFTKGHGIDFSFKLPRISEYELMQPKEYEKVVKNAFKNARFDYSQILKLKLYVESDIMENYTLYNYNEKVNNNELTF